MLAVGLQQQRRMGSVGLGWAELVVHKIGVVAAVNSPEEGHRRSHNMVAKVDVVVWRIAGVRTLRTQGGLRNRGEP